METLQVELDELGHVVRHLNALSGELGATLNGHAPPYMGEMGSARISGAVDHFFSAWSDGMKVTRKNLQGLAEGLGKAEDAYRNAESKIAQCAGGRVNHG